MITLWRQLSDTYRILIFMLFLIVLIQLSNLFYIWKFESKVLLERERESLEYQLDVDAKLLQSHLKSLKKELEFLSTLEVLDDLLVNDMDKRIGILLEKKSKDLAEGTILLAMRDKKMVASSVEHYKKEEFLLFKVSVYASFDKHQQIGDLHLLYPFTNLMQLNIENPNQQLWLKPPFFKEGFDVPKIKDSIVVSQRLTGALEGWELYLSYEEKYALNIIKEIESILLFGSLFSLFSLLLVISILYRKQIDILHYTQEILELKRTFLSTMSHELRTPLGSILNLTQHLMISPKIGDGDVDMLKRIENSSEHLLSMINNLLQLSKLESRTMIVQKESVDISMVIEEMIEMVEPLIDEKNLQLEKQLLDKEKIIITDIHLFKQIVMNLLSNAIKFTHKGAIVIELKEQNGIFEFTVIDTGIGIDKNKQKGLFSEFYQAHMGGKEIKHSTGLGLALSQKVAELIHGKIKIESEGVGKGVKATFSFLSL
ncbi:MAG TPA: HAMP domain-containing histidine kinase [Campylobacterales bacterium]|nr:HAMP domain-containing histidine kinase [Campylobacterales bacterium]